MKTRKNKILVTGGKTGGHIYPAVAIAKVCQDEYKCEITYVGAKDGLEAKVLEDETKIKFIGLRVGPLVGVGFFKKIKSLFQLFFAIVKCMGLLRKERPKLIVGTGGFVSAPLLIAAYLKRVPFVIHEQNVAPGLANRLFGRLCQEIWMTFSESAINFPDNKRKVLVGMPLRSEFLEKSKNRQKGYYDLLKDRITLLVTGGSQGSKVLNDAIFNNYETICNSLNINIVHLTGRKLNKEVLKSLGKKEKSLIAEKKLIIKDYEEHMMDSINSVDVVLTRSGASIICELIALNTYSLLVPLTHSSSNHQFKNAKAVEKIGLGSIIMEKELGKGVLIEKLKMIKKEDLDNLNVLETNIILGRNTDKIIRKETKKFLG